MLRDARPVGSINITGRYVVAKYSECAVDELGIVHLCSAETPNLKIFHGPIQSATQLMQTLEYFPWLIEWGLSVELMYKWSSKKHSN